MKSIVICISIGQVTVDTAAVLQQQGVKCHLRGETYVKPKGKVTTYFVGVDEKGMLEKADFGEEESTSLWQTTNDDSD